ncbi:MAG: patatin-like phospholipase RssA [Gammaproteobacteria bacterium]|nr:patatin-like phospholipase RssA [Gammaproteobacteria bacterium]MBQ0839835.1 patatin-like phospholipase RssA [Gammaproteobacteria bacterium]
MSSADPSDNKVKIGLALGSGSARGWSHIGVIEALQAHGIEPDIICGCSIGALVGASYAANKITSLEDWVRSLSLLEIARFASLDTSLNGVINKQRLQKVLRQFIGDEEFLISDLQRTFASVATDLSSGREIWFTEGRLLDAVWASIALPGLFPPVRHKNRWLVDGGLVNPVPVSVCRALGADFVIAVNLNGNLLGRHIDKPGRTNAEEAETRWSDKLPWALGSLKQNSTGATADEKAPRVFETIASSINIIQDRITRSRMVGEPPDILITPELADIGLLEFYRAGECIDEGKQSVHRALPEIQRFLKTS